MIKRGDFVALIAVTIVFCYAIAIGTTFNGVLTPDFHVPTLVMTALIVVAWLLVHWRRGWVWHRTPLDGVMLLWIAAFGLSLVANLESWRRISIGLWYMSAYIGVWYMLHDIIANEGVSRETLVDGLLICGLIVLIFGFVQSRDWFLNTLPLMLSRVMPFGLPRPVSTLGNPNALANFLVVIIPFAMVRTVSARLTLGRIVMGLYSLAALFLLFLTYSRGAWIGTAAGIGIWGILLLAQHDMLSRQAFRAWWVEQKLLTRVLTFVASGVSVIAVAIVLIIFLRSFSEGGRTTGLRTDIYKTAITMFSEKPLTGYGLFTFGRGLVRLQSVPPTTPHSHAHDTPLLIAAELGIPGLLALFSTLGVMVWAARRNWHDMTNRQRALLSGAASAVVAFAVHELTDIPATTPAIVFAGLVALALMMTSVKPVPLASRLRRIEHPFAMAGLWIVLLISGFWTSKLYTDYVNALLYAIKSDDFRGAAAQMQPVIDADPSLNLYYKEQGLLYGLAANDGDVDAARQGIIVYEKFVSHEPDYAIVWANLATLQWGLGDQDAGFQSMQRAVTLAPEGWQLAVSLGQYADALGKTEVAKQAYEQAIEVYPDSSLLPELEKFRQDDVKLNVNARMALLLSDDKVEQAANLWAENPQPTGVITDIMDALLALAQKDRTRAENDLSKAAEIASGDAEQEWVHLGRARLAQFDGDTDTANSELDLTRSLMNHGIFEGDFVDGLSVAYAQFLSLGFPRQFLPQVYFPVEDAVFLYLVNHT
ncbi:MAG: O-antigen ligase family protein [Chloroflexota bacterium]